MIYLPLAVFWPLLLWGAFSRRPVLLYLLAATTPLGTLSVLPPQLLGGFNALPGMMIGLVLILRTIFLRRDGLGKMLNFALSPRFGLLLTLYVAWTIFVTLFVPRLFGGQIEVISMSPGADGGRTILAPSRFNISQLLYLNIAALGYLAACVELRKGWTIAHINRAILVTGAICAITGALDLVGKSVNIEPLLAPFRTASYAILTTQELADGAQRIIGLMPEPSAFGAVTMVSLSLVLFLRETFENPGERKLANVLVILLLIFVFLSTSSAAYAALFILFSIYFIDLLTRTSAAGGLKISRHVVRDFSTLYVILIALTFLLLVSPELFDPMMERINMQVFEKTETKSYDERSMWNRVTMQAGLDSFLTGVGLGSSRASSQLVAVFGAAGVLGVVFYFGFIFQKLWQGGITHTHDTSSERAYAKAYLPGFFLSLLISSSAAFSFGMGLILLAAMSSRSRQGNTFAASKLNIV